MPETPKTLALTVSEDGTGTFDLEPVTGKALTGIGLYS